MTPALPHMPTSCEANTPAKSENSTLSGGARSSDYRDEPRIKGMWDGLTPGFVPPAAATILGGLSGRSVISDQHRARRMHESAQRDAAQ